MADQQNPNSLDSSTKVGGESSKSGSEGAKTYRHYKNPPDATIPDSSTLRDQWRFAVRQYSKWYSHAWGTAILAGASFFALGWFIKGSNPLPSRHHKEEDEGQNGPSRQPNQDS
ncbi:hypothetical protein MKW94_008880 [Papaver nudicaule]|uniref:Uncharacterized protein n=1 Tax=Papaver nudicaule TaxID=74823 RepID=A0AA41S9J4_PAPNU|nr:hypothetical protein [Papaver nudicaule]